MRPLAHSQRDDSGVASILVIITMTAILVGAAFAIDVGGYVATARSAQSSADGTVLAVAADCALGNPLGDYLVYRKDGQTITNPECDDGVATITVTDDVDGVLLSQSVGDVSRRAVARWDTFGQAATAPLIVADCEFERALLGSLDEPQDDVVVYLDSPPDGFGCSSTAGGFSLLDAPTRDNPTTPFDDRCNVDVTLGDSLVGFEVQGQPGNALRPRLTPCFEPLPQPILIPMYDSGLCELSNCRVRGRGPYQVLGFAMFTVTGYAFGPRGAGLLADGCPAQGPGMGQLSCIRGNFVRFLPPRTGSPVDCGEGCDFGAYKVYLDE